MRAFAASLCLLAAACGGSDAQCVIDTDCPVLQRCSAQQCVPIGGEVDSGVDSGVRDSGADTGTTDAGMDTGTPVVGRGTIAVSQLRGLTSTYSVFAAFGPIEENPTCSTTTEGPCSVQECITAPPMDAGVPDAAVPDAGPDTGTPTLPNAGDIDIAGTMVSPLTLAVDPAGGYTPLSGAVLLFDGSETLTVTAPGAEVPALDEDVSAAAPVTVTAPSFVTSPLVIDRAADFVITWTEDTAGAPENVRATLTGRIVPPEGGLRRVTLTCSFSGGAGTGTVPTAALMNLPADATNSRLTITSASGVTTTAGGWETSISTTNSANADTGNAATIPTSYPSGSVPTP